MARMLALTFAVLVVLTVAGCEITASAYVQKDWNTDHSLYKNNDMVTKFELKASKLVGVDAKKVK